VKPAQFEEKEYEEALYRQLVLTSNQSWSPGQVLEQYLGFDGGLFLIDHYIWRLHGFSFPLSGIAPYRELWPVLPRRPRDRSRLPSFDLNLFIQTKRPYVGRRPPAELARRGLTKPFFKILTDSEQQQCLDAANAQLSDRALFVYAGAVFGSSAELFGHITAGTIVQNSTFPNAAALSEHHAWYYSSPGATGVTNQGFESVELPPLTEQIAELRARRLRERRGEVESQSANLRKLSDVFKATIRENRAIVSTARAAYLSEEWRNIDTFSHAFNAPSAVTSFLEVEAFARFYALRWLVIDDFRE
jgi:hypothetical protein